MPRLVCPILILNIVSANIFLPLGKVIEMVRLRTSFILSWEIGSPPTGGAGRMKLSCVVPSSVTLHLSVNTVSVDSSPHFGGVQSFC